MIKADLAKLCLDYDGKSVFLGEDMMDMPGPEDVLEWFALLEAGWVYNDNPSQAHAILSSGKHSNGFFLCKRVLKHGNLRQILAACMIDRLRGAGLQEVDGVFGSPYSSIMLAADVGRLLKVPTYVPEKDPADPSGKTMILKADDPIPEGARLLQIEELITEFGSGKGTRDAVLQTNPGVGFAPFVGVLVHRPPKIERVLPDGREIVPFIEKQVDAWPPEGCPLCKLGSEAVKPKGKDWAKLIA